MFNIGATVRLKVGCGILIGDIQAGCRRDDETTRIFGARFGHSNFSPVKKFTWSFVTFSFFLGCSFSLLKLAYGVTYGLSSGTQFHSLFALIRREILWHTGFLFRKL
jgi:hypothetical protein